MPLPTLLAPLLSKGLDVIAGAVAVKGKKAVENLIGMPIPDNPSDEQATELRIRMMEHEEKLIELAQQEKKMDLEEMKMVFEDKDSARERETQIATSEKAPYLNKIITPVLAIGSLLFAFLLVGVMVMLEVDDSSKDILVYALGFASSAATQVLSYYFGASDGNKPKFGGKP